MWKIITEQNLTLRKKGRLLGDETTLKPPMTFNFMKPPKPPDITHQQEITSNHSANTTPMN